MTYNENVYEFEKKLDEANEILGEIHHGHSGDSGKEFLSNMIYNGFHIIYRSLEELKEMDKENE